MALSLSGARQILGVSPGDSLWAVQAAYRRRAREWHPDLNHSPQAAERMKAINLAYEALREALLKGRGQPARRVATGWRVPAQPAYRPQPASPASQRFPEIVVAAHRRSPLWLFCWTSAFGGSAIWLWLASEGWWFALPATFAAWAIPEWHQNRPD